jgi:predicted oxidoreductase
VGEALEPVHDRVKIATKFGIRFDTESGKVHSPIVPDSRPEVIKKSVEGSLKRLRTDRIDLYFQHRIDPNVEPEVVAGVMADLIKEGKILHWGISEANEDYLRRANAVCPVTAVENRYSMMARHYNLVGTVFCILRIYIPFKKKEDYFCSEFVSEQLKKMDSFKFKKKQECTIRQIWRRCFADSRISTVCL